MHYNFLLHLRLEIEVSIMARIHRTSRLDQPNPKVVWCKEVVSLMPVRDVVGMTLESMVKAQWVI